MAWNRPKEGTGEREEGRGERRNVHLKGLIAGAVAVLGAAVAAWWLWPEGEARQDAASTKRGLIKEQKPAIAQTNAVAKLTRAIEYRKLEDGRIMKYVDGNAAWMFPRQDYHGPVHTSGLSRVVSIEQKTFKHTTDRQIASLILMRPGGSVFGNPRYGADFVERFLKSFDNPAIPEPGDSEEQKELKHAVAEVKAELKSRYDAGEDIVQILKDTRNELRELSAYRKELEQHVRDFSKDGKLSAEDIEDCINAANQMLQSRGIEPMKVRGFLKYQLMLRKNKGKEGVTNE